MAFYTSRVDNDGNEIKSHLSSRSSAPSLTDSCASSQVSLSSRSFDTKSGSVRMSTRRYINPAVYVESAFDGYDIENGCEKTISKCFTKPDTQSDIVPPLDLQSEENYPTTRDYTYSYRKHCEAAKLELKPELAYETWLSAKRKILSDEAERRRQAEEMKRKELEERKRLSQEKYEKWLENKSRQQKQHSSQSLNQRNPSHSVLQAEGSQMNEEEAKTRLDEWERTKRMQLERRRMLRRQEEQRQRETEEHRRRAAAEAWANWSAGADKKPKPVPLNRGIFTLRGTISDIFVNPNEWQPILPIDGNGDN